MLLRIIVVLGVISVVASCAPLIRHGGSETELLEANRRYDAALVAADSAVLDHLYLPDFIYIGPDAVMRTKEQQIRALTSGTVDVLEGVSDNLVIKRYGDTAVMTGRFTGRARVEGTEFSFRERYSVVWLYREGAWRLVLEHGTVIRDAP